MALMFTSISFPLLLTAAIASRFVKNDRSEAALASGAPVPVIGE